MPAGGTTPGHDLGHDLVLGSASARRRELLASAGIAFRVVTADIDETALSGEEPAQYLERIVAAKLAAVADRVRSAGDRNAWILCADTIVVIGSSILGKPPDDAAAVTMLERLVGSVHEVMTRFALRSPAGDVVAGRLVTTRVHMRSADAGLIQAYVRTGEGRDKAGSYAIQGIGGFLVERIDGSYSNVVGLPLAEVVLDLEPFGFRPHLPEAGLPDAGSPGTTAQNPGL